MDEKHPFFTKVQELAQEHGVLAYVIVAAVEKPDAIGIATAAGTKLKEDHPTVERTYAAMERAFEVGMREIVRRDEEPDAKNTPPKGGLLN